MNSKQTNQVKQEQASRESLGGRLRATRESQHKSLEEAAEATRISQRQLTALEANDFATLPAEVFTRGFIKLYAEYLGLAPAEVLKLFTDQENLDPERPADRPYRRDILHGTSMAHPLNLIRGNPRVRVIAVLLAALLSFYTLGAIFKAVQKKHAGLDTPETEVAKSLVGRENQPLPVAPGAEQTPPGEATTFALSGTPAQALPTGTAGLPGQTSPAQPNPGMAATMSGSVDSAGPRPVASPAPPPGPAAGNSQPFQPITVRVPSTIAATPLTATAPSRPVQNAATPR